MVNFELKKLKLFAILQLLFLFLSLTFIGISYSTITPKEDSVKEINNINKIIYDLNVSYSNLAQNKSPIDDEYKTREKLYLELQKEYDKFNKNNLNQNDDINSIKTEILKIEENNLNLQKQINSLEIKLK